MAGRLDALDDPDYPAYTTGRAAEVLGMHAGRGAADPGPGDDLAAERALTARLHERLGAQDGQAN